MNFNFTLPVFLVSLIGCSIQPHPNSLLGKIIPSQDSATTAISYREKNPALEERVVRIMIENSNGQTLSHGTGFVVGRRSGLLQIVTANHVVRSIKIHDEPAKNQALAYVKFADTKSPRVKVRPTPVQLGNLDLAVIEIPMEGTPFQGRGQLPYLLPAVKGSITPFSNVTLLGPPPTNGGQGEVLAAEIENAVSSPGQHFIIAPGAQAGFSGSPIISTTNKIVGFLVSVATEGEKFRYLPIEEAISATISSELHLSLVQNEVSLAMENAYEQEFPLGLFVKGRRPRWGAARITHRDADGIYHGITFVPRAGSGGTGSFKLTPLMDGATLELFGQKPAEWKNAKVSMTTTERDQVGSEFAVLEGGVDEYFYSMLIPNNRSVPLPALLLSPNPQARTYRELAGGVDKMLELDAKQYRSALNGIRIDFPMSVPNRVPDKYQPVTLPLLPKGRWDGAVIRLTVTFSDGTRDLARWSKDNLVWRFNSSSSAWQKKPLRLSGQQLTFQATVPQGAVDFQFGLDGSLPSSVFLTKATIELPK